MTDSSSNNTGLPDEAQSEMQPKTQTDTRPEAQPEQQAETQVNPKKQPKTAAQDSYWGNPPQTPATHPVPSSEQNHSTGQAPQPPQTSQAAPATQVTPVASTVPPKKKHTTALIVGIIIAAVVVVGIAGCALGTFAYRTLTSHMVQNQQSILGEDNSSDDEPFALEPSDIDDNNENFRRYYDIRVAEEDYPITETELSQIATKLKNNQSSDESESYQAGVYYVGKDLPAGTYWIQGNENALSYFFVLSSANSGNAAGASYNVWMVNHYYGNSIIEVSDGDVLVINQEATPIDQVKQQFTAPYKSGVYRVGTDIPEGTYTLSAGNAHDYYAYYVMSNATYKGNCYLAYDNFLNVNYQPTITLKAGTYIELYNVTLKSNTV